MNFLCTSLFMCCVLLTARLCGSEVVNYVRTIHQNNITIQEALSNHVSSISTPSSNTSSSTHSSSRWQRHRRSFSHERHIEIMVVADAKMAQYHGENLQHYILTLMATVSDCDRRGWCAKFFSLLASEQALYQIRRFFFDKIEL